MATLPFGPQPYTMPAPDPITGLPVPFTGQEKNAIRTYLYNHKVWVTPNALLETDMLTINGLINDPTDGYGQTLISIRYALQNLYQLEFNLALLEQNPMLLSTLKIEGQIVVDYAQTVWTYRNITGPAYITQLQIHMAYDPDWKYFAPARTAKKGDNSVIVKYHAARYGRR